MTSLIATENNDSVMDYRALKKKPENSVGHFPHREVVQSPSGNVPQEIRLTARQKAMVRALFSGAAPKQLAHDLGTHPQAVYDCLAKVRRKLGVTNDIQLGVAFDRMGLL